MKDDRVCEYCTYKHVPTAFSPCLGCKAGNMNHLVKKEEKEHGKTNI